MWLFIACLGYTLLALVSLLDKIVVSREKVQPLAFAFFSTVILVPFALALPFVSSPDTLTLTTAIILAGIAYGIALYTMYAAFEAGEVSHNGPLIGAITPVCTLILSQFFLQETLTALQMGAVGLLVLGSLVISFKKNAVPRDWQHSVMMSAFAGLSFAVFFIAAKYIYETMGFGPGFLWIMASTGLFGLLLLVFPTVRHFVRGNKQSSAQKKQSLGVMLFDKAAAGGAVLLIQFALSLGNTTVVNALTGLQYALLIVLVAVVSKVKPTLFHEDYEPGEILQEGLAVILIIGGLALLVL